MDGSPELMLNWVAPPPSTRICAALQPSCWKISVRRYFSIDVIEANAAFGDNAHDVGSTTAGASVLPPLNVNVPPKFCGERLCTLSFRKRTPNRHKCLPATIEVLFCSSRLF